VFLFQSYQNNGWLKFIKQNLNGRGWELQECWNIVNSLIYIVLR